MKHISYRSRSAWYLSRIISMLLTLQLQSLLALISSAVSFIPVVCRNHGKGTKLAFQQSKTNRRSQLSLFELHGHSNNNNVERENTVSTNDEYAFRPKFDGQLYYGMAADSQGKIQTTLSEVKSKMKISSSTDVDIDAAQLTTATSFMSTKPSPATRERTKLHNTPIISRTITIPPDTNTDSTLSVTVWEMEKPSTLIEYWMSTDTSASDKDKIGDPFGVVMWPGSILASREIMNRRHIVANATVLVLGAGLGLEVQTAARMGAAKVIATDNNPFTLKLLRYGAQLAGLDHVIETQVLDICDERTSLPGLAEVDMVVVADLLYNERLARFVGKRCWEVLLATRQRKREQKRPITLVVTDSQRFLGTDFLRELNVSCRQENMDELEWKEVILRNVTGSGILIDEDQTYDVKARMLCVDN